MRLEINLGLTNGQIMIKFYAALALAGSGSMRVRLLDRRKTMTKQKFLSAIMVGGYISLGAMTYLMIPNTMVASLFFATGIFLVFNFNNMLFTRVCPLTAATGEYKPIDWLCAWVGNAVGAFLVASIAHFSRFEGKIAERLQSVGQMKLDDSFISLVIMGFFCAVLVSYAVLIGKKFKAGSFPQIFFVWLFITAFVFCGFDHIVANMYYISAYSLAFGVQPLKIILSLAAVTIGNIIGGLLIGTIEKKHIPDQPL